MSLDAADTTVCATSHGLVRQGVPLPTEPALVLAPEAPYPLVGGGALRTASLIHYLARTRDVDLILFQQPGAPDPAQDLPAGLARRVSVIHLPPTGRGQAARTVRNAIRLARGVPPLVDRFSGFQREVAEAIGGARYGVGVIEHSWCAPYAEQISPACRWTSCGIRPSARWRWE